jgi:hypothetical protein
MNSVFYGRCGKMYINKPLCRHSEIKQICKWYRDGNCSLNISDCKAPCEKIKELDIVSKIENITIDMEHKLKFYLEMMHECEEGYYQDKFYTMADVLGECLGKIKGIIN